MGSVLIIDAEEDFAQRIAEKVRAHGVESTLTSDGKAGLDMAHINIPDAIVLCVELPRMSGYSICAKLKKDATLKSVPLIITSAEATQETFEHHKKLKTRAEEYLKKPFEPDVLLDLLSRYVTLEAGANGADGNPAEMVPVLADDEAFSGDETIAMASSDLSDELIDDPIDNLEAVPPPLPVDALETNAGMSQRFEEDEVMTTVGQSPAANEQFLREMGDLKRMLQVEREGRAKAERERDLAIANEKAAAAQAQALNASTPPTAASTGRELLEVKKQLNAKEHELLETADKVHERDKQIVALRDREMELEGAVVNAQEDKEASDRARAEAEGKIAAAEAKAEELERSSQQQLDELNRQLGQAAAHEAELDGALQTKSEEYDAAAETIRAREDEIAEHKRTQQALNADVTRVTNELSAATAEADSLRKQIDDKEQRVAELSQQVSQVEADLASKAEELEATMQSLKDAEDRASRAYQRIRDDEEVKNKARQALEIATSLLQEGGAEAVNVDGEEART